MLLQELSYLCSTVEFIRYDELGSDIQVILVNDKECYDLDTNLNDGDQVTVMVEVTPLGGG